MKKQKTLKVKETSQFHIVFPTKKQATNSRTPVNEMICLQSKHYDSSFPKNLLFNAIAKESHRKDYMFHSKVK